MLTSTVPPIAYDWVRFAFIREGSAVFHSEFGERRLERGDLGVMSRDVVESVEGYAANRRVVSVVVVEVEPAGQRQASFGL